MKPSPSNRRLLMALVLAAAAVPASAESLFEPAGYRPLTADQRATRVGDIVTILIVEAASAESRADSSEEAEFSIEAGLTDASGLNRAGVDVATGSRGEGRTARAGRLRAQMSARIEEVLASGDFMLRGSQLITINGEQQRISLQGVVRPADIGAGNSVLSSRLADARIEYRGEGWIARNEKPGLFRRLLQFIGF